jgi:hypothetical protein
MPKRKRTKKEIIEENRRKKAKEFKQNTKYHSKLPESGALI